MRLTYVFTSSFQISLVISVGVPPGSVGAVTCGIDMVSANNGAKSLAYCSFFFT